MDKNTIAQEIIQRVENAKTVNFASWRIGLTHDPKSRIAQHGAEGLNTQHWLQWEADSLSDAQEIELYFVSDKGMKGGTGGDLSASMTVYVYIF